MKRSTKRKKVLQVPNCDMRFYEDELKILSNFFNCKSSEEVIQAAKRYENLLYHWTSEHEVPLWTESQASLRLALILATESYLDFKNLGQPLTYKHLKKKSGPREKEGLPDNANELIQDLISSGEVSNKLAAVKCLQRRKKLPLDYHPAGLLRKIEKTEKTKKALIANISLFTNFENTDIS